MPGFDLKQINRNDQVVMGAGALAFILSFFPDYEISGSFGLISRSVHYSGWQGIGILSILFFVAAGAIVALRAFAGAQLPVLPLSWNVITGGLAALGTLFLLLEGFVIFDPYGVSGHGISTGFAWGGYILLIVGIVQTVFAYLTIKASGEKIAWDAAAMNKPAASGDAPAATPYPPQSAPTYPPTAPADPAYPADPGTPGV